MSGRSDRVVRFLNWVALFVVALVLGLAIVWLKHRTDWLLAQLPIHAEEARQADGWQEDARLRLVMRIDRQEHQIVALRAALGVGATILSPSADAVYQQKDGVAKVPLEILAAHGSRIAVTIESLADGGQMKPAVESREVTLPSGMYRICLSINGGAGPCHRFGVGELFVVVGQSNATSEGIVPVRSRSERISVTLPGEQEVFRDPFLAPLVASLAWVHAGDHLEGKLPVPLGFINVAYGGTTTAKWLPGMPLFERLTAVLERNPVRGVLWWQGEADCGMQFDKAQTYANMRTLITQARQVQDVPWVVALASSRYQPNCAAKQAQAQLIADGIAFPGPDTEVVPKGVGEHFDDEGIKRLGAMWGDVLWHTFFKEEYK